LPNFKEVGQEDPEPVETPAPAKKDNYADALDWFQTQGYIEDLLHDEKYYLKKLISFVTTKGETGLKAAQEAYHFFIVQRMIEQMNSVPEFHTQAIVDEAIKQDRGSFSVLEISKLGIEPGDNDSIILAEQEDVKPAPAKAPGKKEKNYQIFYDGKKTELIVTAKNKTEAFEKSKDFLTETFGSVVKSKWSYGTAESISKLAKKNYEKSKAEKAARDKAEKENQPPKPAPEDPSKVLRGLTWDQFVVLVILTSISQPYRKEYYKKNGITDDQVEIIKDQLKAKKLLNAGKALAPRGKETKKYFDQLLGYRLLPQLPEKEVKERFDLLLNLDPKHPILLNSFPSSQFKSSAKEFWEEKEAKEEKSFSEKLDNLSDLDLWVAVKDPGDAEKGRLIRKFLIDKDTHPEKVRNVLDLGIKERTTSKDNHWEVILSVRNLDEAEQISKAYRDNFPAESLETVNKKIDKETDDTNPIKPLFQDNSIVEHRQKGKIKVIGSDWDEYEHKYRYLLSTEPTATSEFNIREFRDWEETLYPEKDPEPEHKVGSLGHYEIDDGTGSSVKKEVFGQITAIGDYYPEQNSFAYTIKTVGLDRDRAEYRDIDSRAFKLYQIPKKYQTETPAPDKDPEPEKDPAPTGLMVGIEILVNALTEKEKEQLTKEGYEWGLHKRNNTYNFIEPKTDNAKYIKIDKGGSGKYMVEIDNGYIYGTKGYGVINKKKYYGTVSQYVKDALQVGVGYDPLEQQKLPGDKTKSAVEEYNEYKAKLPAPAKEKPIGSDYRFNADTQVIFEPQPNAAGKAMQEAFLDIGKMLIPDGTNAAKFAIGDNVFHFFDNTTEFKMDWLDGHIEPTENLPFKNREYLGPIYFTAFSVGRTAKELTDLLMEMAQQKVDELTGKQASPATQLKEEETPGATGYEKEVKRQLDQGLIEDDTQGISLYGITKGQDNPIDKIRKEQEKTAVKANFPIAASLIPSDYKNPYELNRAIENWIEKNLDTKLKNVNNREYTTGEKTFLRSYTGYGGLGKFGETTVGSLYEFYTPTKVIEKMWGLAYKNGYNNGTVLESSVGTGEFFQFCKPEIRKLCYEINIYSAIITKVLYPSAEVIHAPFESHFIKNRYTVKDDLDKFEKFDLSIGNCPFGSFSAHKHREMGAYGEKDHTKATNYVEYFLRRNADLLKPGGLLVMLVGAELMNGGTLWLDSGPSKVKDYLFKHTELLEAYRLPNKVFERTGVTSDIIVLKRK